MSGRVIASMWLVAGILGALGCSRGATTTSDAGPRAEPRSNSVNAHLTVPLITGPITLDGELDEADWTRAARTGAFMDAEAQPARPFSEARFLRDSDKLYVALYAADDDIHALDRPHDAPVWLDDAFALRFGRPGKATEYFLDVSATGVTTDLRRGPNGALDAAWESGAKLAVERDGTVGDASDEDEEWVVELVIPLERFGAIDVLRDGLAVQVERCDTPRGPKREKRCGRVGGAGELATLVLRDK